MVIKMTNENYLMINEATNVVDNVCVWNGDPNTWQPPAGYLMLVQANTMAAFWAWDNVIKDWVLRQEMGVGQIGYTWNGTECVTNEPKPEPPQPQPITQGTQAL